MDNITTGIDYSNHEYKDVDRINRVPINSSTDTTEATLFESNTYKKEEDIKDKTAVTSKEERIVSALDVANYILQCYKEPISTMKMHKLLYYCQAWNLVWDEKPLFKEKIEAWANGPVVRELFNYHRGMYEISKRSFPLGNANILSQNQKETIDSVLRFYGERSAQWLIDQTHSEMPWIKARRGLASNERGDEEITVDNMIEYYSSLK